MYIKRYSNTLILFIRLYLTLDEHVHWVVCAVVKRWALQNNLKNQTMFTSYALAWLVLFYLMTIEVVPPLMLLRNNAVYSKNVPWNQMSDEMFIEGTLNIIQFII